MQIKNLKIDGLYGYLNKDIDFNSDLTLLVGINGSGKTSILNIITWILMPSISNLCVTEFKRIEILFSFKGSQYTILCKHSRGYFSYSIKSDKVKYNSLKVKLRVVPSAIKKDETLKASLMSYYAELAPENLEKKTWDLLSTFPNPTTIGLDRKIYAQESQTLYVEEKIRGRNYRKRSTTSPLDRVKEIVNREYRRKRNDILNLTNKLKNQLMLSTFDGSITVDSFTAGIRHKLTIEQIKNAEERVNNYFRAFEKDLLSPAEKKTIAKYFESLRQITLQYHSDPKNETTKLLYGLNATQFIKINHLLKRFEIFEEESKNAMAQIDEYLRTLNYFFKDSAKKLLFKEDTSELVFNTQDKSGKKVTDFNDLKFLSSGEQQVLILFSYVAFIGGDGRIFIIDEPELSLHVKWQEDFLDNLEKVTPKGTQLILATHSPILANKKKSKAKVLMPYNN